MKKMLYLVGVLLAMLFNPATAQIAAAASLGGPGNPNAPEAKTIKVPGGEAGVKQVYAWFEDMAKQYGENITGYDACMTSTKGEMMMWAIARTEPAEGRKKAVLNGDTTMVPVEAKIYATLTENTDGSITVAPGADERRCMRDKVTYK